MLSFGLRPAPKLYNAVVDALLWILVDHDGINGLHYLDDFLLVGEPDSPQCELFYSGRLPGAGCPWPQKRLRA